MLSKKLKIFLFILFIVTVFLNQIEKFFPNDSYCKNELSRKISDLEIELGRFESSIRSIESNLMQGQSNSLLGLYYPFINEVLLWTPENSSSIGWTLENDEKFLLQEILKNKNGKLVRLKGRLSFALPVNGKLIVTIFNEKELRGFRKEGDLEYFYPEISKIKTDEFPIHTSEVLSYLIGKNSNFTKSKFSIQGKKYDLYYGSPEKKGYGFVEEFLLLKYNSNRLSFTSVLLLIFVAMAFTDTLFFFKRKIKALPKTTLSIDEIQTKEKELYHSIEQPTTHLTEIKENESLKVVPDKNENKTPGNSIFILPFDLVSDSHKEIFITPQFLRKIKEEERNKKEIIITGVNTIREKVFSPELEKLINKVDSKIISDEKKLDDKYEKLFQKIFSDGNAELYNSLNELYDKDYHEHESLGYLKRISKKVGLESVCVSIYNRSMGCYMVSLSLGVDEETKSNLIFQWNDPFLQFEKEEDLLEIHFNNKYLSNVFFRKKFSDSALSKFGGILVYSLKKYSVDGYLVFFFEKNVYITPEKLDIVSKCLNRMIAPFLPIVSGIAKEKIYLQIPDEDILAKVYHEMKEATNAGLEPCSFVKIKVLKFFQTEDSEKILEDIITNSKNYLKKDERILLISHVDIFVIIKNTDSQEFLKEIDKINRNRLQLNIKVNKYPDDGKNFYNFL